LIDGHKLDKYLPLLKGILRLGGSRIGRLEMRRSIGLLALSASLSLCGWAESLGGYIVDQSCAGQKAMWDDAACTARCVKGSIKLVLVTEDGTVYKIANQDKVKSETYYGKKVTVSGKMEGDSITVDSVKI
jgi:hypothetical protein